MPEIFDALYAHYKEKKSFKEKVKELFSNNKIHDPLMNDISKELRDAFIYFGYGKKEKTFFDKFKETFLNDKNKIFSEKQKILKILDKSIKNNINVLLIGETHTICPHSGLETMIIRKTINIAGTEPIVFHEALGDYSEKEIKNFYNSCLKRTPLIKLKIDGLIKDTKTLSYLEPAKDLSIVHLPKDHVKKISNENENLKKAQLLDQYLQKIKQDDLNVYRVLDTTFKLNCRLIGADLKNKTNLKTYDPNLDKKIENITKNNESLKEFFSMLHAAGKEGSKIREQKMAETILNNYEKGNLNIGIFGSEHINSLEKKLKNQGLKVKKIILPKIGYKENYHLPI